MYRRQGSSPSKVTSLHQEGNYFPSFLSREVNVKKTWQRTVKPTRLTDRLELERFPVVSFRRGRDGLSSGVACFAIYRLICPLNSWKRIDKQSVRNGHLKNRLFTIASNEGISIIDRSRLATGPLTPVKLVSLDGIRTAIALSDPARNIYRPHPRKLTLLRII